MPSCWPRGRAKGSSVRVLYDWFGSIATGRGFWRYLRKAGVEVRAFHPPQLVDVVTNVSRNHRKLVVADGSRAVLGGLCIGCEWTGESHAGGQPWRDTAVDIQRPRGRGAGSDVRQRLGAHRVGGAARPEWPEWWSRWAARMCASSAESRAGSERTG